MKIISEGGQLLESDKGHTITNHSSIFFALSCNSSWAKMGPYLCSNVQVDLMFIQPS